MNLLPRALKGVVIACAMTAPLSFPAPIPAAPAAEPIRFARIEWGSRSARVESRLARAGFRLRTAQPGGSWRHIGRVVGRSADLTPEYDVRGGLIAFTLQFHPESESDALRVYADLVAELKRRHGGPAAEIAPARPAAVEWSGRERRLLLRQELTAATLWVSPEEDAVAVQLDAQHYVWLRYEARQWPAAHEAAPH